MENIDNDAVISCPICKGELSSYIDYNHNMRITQCPILVKVPVDLSVTYIDSSPLEVTETVEFYRQELIDECGDMIYYESMCFKEAGFSIHRYNGLLVMRKFSYESAIKYHLPLVNNYNKMERIILPFSIAKNIDLLTFNKDNVDKRWNMMKLM